MFNLKEIIIVGIALFNAVQLLSSTGPHVPSSLHFLAIVAAKRKYG